MAAPPSWSVDTTSIEEADLGSRHKATLAVEQIVVGGAPVQRQARRLRSTDPSKRPPFS